MKVAEVKLLVDKGLFQYGSEMSIEAFADLGSIKHPDLSRMTQIEAINAYRNYELKIVGLYTTINEQLLSIGRKLYRKDGTYNVATVADTLSWVERYNKAGKKKYAKANKLTKGFATTQVVPQEVNTQQARAHIETSGADRFASSQAL